MPLHLKSLAELTGGAKAHKFGAVRTELDGVTHDSGKEARRWAQLQLMQRAGLISDLERQVVYVLAPSVRFDGEPRAKPALRIVVDFQYTEGGRLVLEDSKGVETPVSRIKRHLLASVHGLQLRLT